jgi:hypothetical protein
LVFSARIGAIDLSEDAVRIAVVQTGRSPKLLDHVCVRTVHPEDAGPDEPMLAAVRRALDELEVKPTLFVLVAHTEWSVVRLLRVPFRGRKVSAAVPFELEPFLAFPIEELVTDHLHVREVDGQTEVLVVGVRRQELERRMSILASAEIPVEGVALDAVGLTALWQAAGANGAGLQAAVHVRRNEALLTVVNKRKLVYLHRLPVANDRINTDPAGFARMIRNALRSYASATPDAPSMESLTVTGADFMEAGRTVFDEEFEFRVQHKSLESELAIANDPAPEPNAWAVLCGAAAASAGGPNHLEFLDRSFGAVGDRSDLKSRALATTGLVGAVILAYLVLAFVDYRNNRRELENIGVSMAEVYAELYPNAPGAQDPPASDPGGIATYDRLMAAVEEETMGSRSVSLDEFKSPPLLEILSAVAEHCPASKVDITELSFRPGREKVLVISGELKGDAELDAIVAGLTGTGIFSIDKNRISQRIVEGRRYFEINAGL